MINKLLNLDKKSPEYIFIEKYNYFIIFNDSIFGNNRFIFFDFLKNFILANNENGFILIDVFTREEIQIEFNTYSDVIFNEFIAKQEPTTDIVSFDENGVLNITAQVIEIEKERKQGSLIERIKNYFAHEKVSERLICGNSENWCLYSLIYDEIAIMSFKQKNLYDNALNLLSKPIKYRMHYYNIQEFIDWHKLIAPNKPEYEEFRKKFSLNYCNRD